MCRYAFHRYRDHFACFGCRKAFKHWLWESPAAIDWRAVPRRVHAPREVPCPDCSRPMADMGLDFRAPPRADREAWRIQEVVRRHGFAFHDCGCGSGFRPPRRLREVPAWLAEHRTPTEGERLARRFAARNPGSPAAARLV